jgi:hypothetical protein
MKPAVVLGCTRTFAAVLALSIVQPPLTFADSYYAIGSEHPGKYSVATHDQAINELAAMADPLTHYQGVTPASLAASAAVGHEARIIETLSGGAGGIPGQLNTTVQPVKVIAPQGADVLSAAEEPVQTLDTPVIPFAQIVSQTLNYKIEDVTSCKPITSAGIYIVRGNLAGDNCLTVSNVSDVHIECAEGSSITSNGGFAISFRNSTNLSMQGCNIQGGKPALSMYVSDSQNVYIARNNIAGIELNNVQDSTVEQNHITAQDFFVKCTNVTVASNKVDKIVSPGPNGGLQGMYFASGSRNQALNNDIDGGFIPGVSSGSIFENVDTGIILGNEDQDIIRGNNIRRTFGLGIETTESFTNSIIENNTITGTLQGAVGADHNTSWRNNKVSGNRASEVAYLFFFFYDKTSVSGLPAPSQLYFLDNTFENNTFVRQLSGGNSALFRLQYPDDAHAIMGNNVIRNNNFSPTRDGPSITPMGAFVDGGGNVCASPSSIACLSGPNFQTAPFFHLEYSF